MTRDLCRAAAGRVEVSLEIEPVAGRWVLRGTPIVPRPARVGGQYPNFPDLVRLQAGEFHFRRPHAPIAIWHDQAPTGSAAVKWVVLRSLITPGQYKLHPDSTWDRMAKSERRRWEVVRVCPDRAQAIELLDALKVPGGDGENP